MLRDGKMDDRFVEIEMTQSAMPMIEVLTPQGMEGMEFNLKEMFSNLMPKKTKKKTVKIPEALEILTQEEAGKLVDMDKVTGEAIRRVEQSGIVFLDEIDKIAGRESAHGPDVSRQGVQRDLLPIVEGSYRQHQVRHGQDRSYSVCRFRGVSHGQAVGFDPRVSGALPDPRGAEFARQRRFRAHSHRAEERADQAI